MFVVKVRHPFTLHGSQEPCYDILCYAMIYYDMIYYDMICYTMLCHPCVWEGKETQTVHGSQETCHPCVWEVKEIQTGCCGEIVS